MMRFGHIGDGNLYLNTPKPEDLGRGEFLAKCATVNERVFETIEKHDSSIFVEHGVDMARCDCSTYVRSETETAYMEILEVALNPSEVMNPGKIFAE